MRVLTTPTLTFSGEGSARKASVTPRMGSLGAGSTWPNSDDAIVLACSCSLGSGRRIAEVAARYSPAMLRRRWWELAGGLLGGAAAPRMRGGGGKAVGFGWGRCAAGFCSVTWH